MAAASSYATRPPDPVGADDAPWPALREAYHLFRERWSAHLLRHGLSLPEYIALELCAQAPARASEVARALGVSAAGATDLLDRLEGRHLVRRVDDPEDRRAVRVRLTSAGLRLQQECRSIKRQDLKFLGAAMTPEERRALSRGLDALTRALRAGAARPGGEP